MKRGIAVLLIMLMFSVLAYGAENIQRSGLLKVAALDKVAITEEIHMDVNRVDATMYNNGIWMYDVHAGAGGIWPKGSGNATIFGAGQWIAASVNNQIRCAGIIHDATEYQPGVILSDGTAANPLDGAYQWYIINSDGSGDYSNWPVDQGAPVDESGNPQVYGDRTAFCVWNDLGNHPQFGTNKLGAEVRQTVFAFNRADAMGDMMFIRWEIINKGEADWDSTYLSIWVDPDVGGYDDDFVGCDDDLGLGYCYNADNDDQDYGTAPPAVGVDFFQGPVIDMPDSTVVLPDGTELQDKMMLGMTAFVYYNNDDSEQGNPDTQTDVWNYMRGFWRDGSPITEGGTGTDPTNPPTAFMFTGDPETGTGWLDDNAADRRFLMTVGPFDMPMWDDENSNGKPDFGETGVQVIVAAVINARGANNLNSVTVLKEVDNLAQLAYDLNFKLARPPSPPRYMNETDSEGNSTILLTELPNEVILTWDDYSEFNQDGSPYESADPIVGKAYGDTVIIDNLETVINDSTYNYYGYTVYQYSDAAGSEPVQLAHWDVGKQASAVPYTGSRHFRIVENKHATVGTVGDPLIDGKEYYFGVVPEGYCEFGAPTIFQGAATIVTAVPQHWPGEVLGADYLDTLDVTHALVDTEGDSGLGSVIAYVVDPREVTGDSYTVDFNPDGSWNLLRGADTLAANETNLSGDDNYIIHDGLMIKVLGPPLGMDPGHLGDFYSTNYGPDYASYDEAYLTGWDFDGLRWITGRDKGWPGLFGGLGNGADHLGTTLVNGSDYYDVEVQFAGTPSTLTGAETTVAEIAALGIAESPDRWSQIAIIDGWGTWEISLGWAPMSAWDLRTDPPQRLKIGIIEDAVNANGYWDMGWNPVDSTYIDEGNYEYIYILSDEYDEEYTDYLSGALYWYMGWPILYTISPAPRSGYYYLEDEFEIQIFASKVLTPNDVFTFKAPDAKSVVEANAKTDLKKILVVPNPYYGYHSGEMDPFDRWVQFTNLPEKCTISIFDLAGHLVRKLEKDDETTSLLQWDLHNAFDLPVASGIYVYYVDVPNVGTKIGKMAVFTPNERLDTY